MKSLSLFLTLCGLLAITTFSCYKRDNLSIATTTDSTLMKSKWMLTAFQDTKTNQMTNYPENIPQEFITVNDSLIFVNGICNCGACKYTIKDESIVINPSLGWTKIDCINMEQWETNFFNNIENAFQYKITESNNLVLYSHGSYNLFFVASSN
jgi:heat shock protein HslJ